MTTNVVPPTNISPDDRSAATRTPTRTADVAAPARGAKTASQAWSNGTGTPHALIVDDDVNFVLGLAEVVGREGFSTSTANSMQQARVEMSKRPADVILADLQLPDGSGLELLQDTATTGTAEIILITGHASIETAVEALRRGAADYLTKPVDLARVKMVLANLIRTHELREEIGTLRTELRKLGHFGPLVGASAPMQKVYDLITRVARTEATILITGETGTGKELVAQAIHEHSRRHKEAFIPVNCGAVSPTLIESEMFGHERGSFTGADRLHRGYFERANRGTLLLDEITEMPAELQVKLLRVLETGFLSRIGGTEQIKADVRVIAATNRNPDEAVSQGKLREDLLYRLNVFPIAIAPLRERPGDVELLAEHFLEQLNRQEGAAKRFTAACVERLVRHDWPGNVRELKNVVQRAYILAEDEIGPESLPLGAGPEQRAVGNLTLKVGMSIAEAERRLLLATLDSCGGDKKKASEILQISLKTLYNRLREYNA
jgi:two-component system, NtrC family, response regulator HydG